VHLLLTACRAKCFFKMMTPKLARDGIVTAPSSMASLDRRGRVRTIQPRSQRTIDVNVNTAVHRFKESIFGQPYLFEVAAVAQDRWRACIVRIPGVPTALMPFYGPTPDEAADRLRQWLTRAHAQASCGVRRV
jgi:hypothetical protein